MNPEPWHGETMELLSPHTMPQVKQHVSTTNEIYVSATVERLDPQGQMQPSLQHQQQPLPDLELLTHRYQAFSCLSLNLQATFILYVSHLQAFQELCLEPLCADCVSSLMDCLLWVVVLHAC